MKKRVISTLLCATMLVGMITGCGSNNTESACLLYTSPSPRD